MKTPAQIKAARANRAMRGQVHVITGGLPAKEYLEKLHAEQRALLREINEAISAFMLGTVARNAKAIRRELSRS